MDYREMILHELERVNSIIDMMANPEKYDEKEVLKTASWFGLIPNWNRIEKRLSKWCFRRSSSYKFNTI